MLDLQDNIRRIEAELETMKQQLIEQEKSKMVELEGGDWYIDTLGVIDNASTTINSRNFGAEFKTKELAEKALVDMRKTNRLRNLAMQIDPDFIDEFDYTKHNNQPYLKSCYIYNNSGEWKTGSNTNSRYYGTIVMSKSTAEKICQLLNDGLFEL